MLEQKIEALTAAVLALTEVMRRGAVVGEPMPASELPIADAPPKAEKPKAAKPKADDVKEAARKVHTIETVEYDVMAKAFKDYIATKGRDEAIQLLATFDAKTLKDVPEAKWGVMMKAIS